MQSQPKTFQRDHIFACLAYCFRIFLEGSPGTTLRLPTKTSKQKSMGGKCDLQSFQLIPFHQRKLCSQRSHWIGGGGLRPQHLFQKQQQSCGSLFLDCFSKNYLCGFRLCFHSGWDGEGSDLSTTLLSPKVYGTRDKPGFCFFLFSRGCSPHSRESGFSWALPSQPLQTLALLEKEQLFGLGAVTVPSPAGMWSYCSGAHGCFYLPH